LIATVDKTSTEDHQQIFQTNYFGVVHGSIAAVRYFRRKREPAALINLGSVVSDMPIPLSVAYSATKHAIKGFTDGLRNELMQEELPISVTLIKPSAIDTRFFDHAKTEMGGMGKAPGLHYAPEVVAAAIINARNAISPSVRPPFSRQRRNRWRRNLSTSSNRHEAFRSRRLRPFARCGLPA
jgi:short-subunit dehydrogenase